VLGSQRSGFRGLILGEVAILIGIGLVVGLGLTLAGGKAASSMLLGLKPRDPLTLALVAFIPATIALASGFLPAHRASRLDPMITLRYE
jgi:ABC-type antimicrobial peptide transport system permease subunit